MFQKYEYSPINELSTVFTVHHGCSIGYTSVFFFIFLNAEQHMVVPAYTRTGMPFSMPPSKHKILYLT